jgi:hypothetical protein
MFIRRTLQGLFGLLALVGSVIFFWLSGAIWRHFVRFPREQGAWAALREQRQPVADDAGWHEYRGILHSHSKLSHDCQVSFEEILSALNKAGLDFICLSDHCVAGRADFDWQWRGLHEGKLFVPGFEMKEGIMPFGVRSGVVLSNATDVPTLARQIVQGGGVLFYAHPEEPRDWDRPELTGMEIYNIHSDFKAQGDGFTSLLPDLLVNQRAFPEQVFRRILRRPTPFLEHWDALNRTRHLTGIAGNDCHQNSGVRAVVTATNTIWFEDTSPRKLMELKLRWWTRPLARLAFGPLEPNRELFRFQPDPYERMARFVNTHVLVRDLTEPKLLDSLRSGRVYVGFDLIADSAGFRWLAEGRNGKAVMGETARFSADSRLRALSPEPCRFTVVKDGSPVYQSEGRVLDWAPPGSGKYRVEAELTVLGEWVPWVYANPIELRD